MVSIHPLRPVWVPKSDQNVQWGVNVASKDNDQSTTAFMQSQGCMDFHFGMKRIKINKVVAAFSRFHAGNPIWVIALSHAAD